MRQRGARVTVIRWSSSNAGVISNAGVVTRPSTENVTVTLTATISKGSESDAKEFDLVVVKDSAGGYVEKIVYQSNADGDYEIFIVNIDGTDAQQLTSNAFNDGSPKILPDGTKIVFYSDRSGDGRIWFMDADGGNPFQLNTAKVVHGFNVNSAGDQIVYSNSGLGGCGQDIYMGVINIDGTNEQVVYENLSQGRGGVPAWIPGIESILYYNEPGGTCNSPNMEIFKMNIDGTGQTALTSNSVMENSPVSSLNGSKILFIRALSGYSNTRIFIMDIDGANSSQLVMENYDASGIAWSLDGSKIVFGLMNGSGDYDVAIANADGSNVVRVVNDSAHEFAPYWGRILVQ